MSFKLACVLGTVLATAPTAVAPPTPPSQPAHADWKLEQPKHLSEVTRALLRKRMHRHAQDMSDLVLAVTLLLHKTSAELATAIASEPRLLRPTAGTDDELNRALPERFFALQDQLQAHARALAAAANAKDDAAMGKHLGQLTQTCVACHASYLNPR